MMVIEKMVTNRYTEDTTLLYHKTICVSVSHRTPPKEIQVISVSLIVKRDDVLQTSDDWSKNNVDGDIWIYSKKLKRLQYDIKVQKTNVIVEKWQS